jgi:nucleoside-diphosphate-sugar epimerase
LRYVVTGGSGYIGSRLIERLAEREDTEGITIWDVRPPRGFRPGVRYEEVDVRDRERVRELMGRERPDTVVHLAFILNPMHDENAMYEIDVGGTQNVLEAASAADVGHVFVTSSATAYGAFPDNPVPLTEEHPVRGVPDFEYVHEDDLVEAFVLLLEGRHGGVFNVAGDGYVHGSELAELIGMKRRRVPLKLYRRLAEVMWKLRQSETPAGQINFAIHPWVASNEKLKRETGWRPKHTSRETFEITMRSRGVLDGGESPPVGTPKIGTPAGV